MIGARIPFETARKSTSGNKGRLWGQGNQSGLARIRQDFPDLFLQPKFKIPQNASFFTIGSCFAREIELALDARKIECLSYKTVFPAPFYDLAKTEGTNGALNAYTPHSIRDLLRLASRPDAATAGILRTGEDENFDMLLSGLRPLTDAEAQQARAILLETYARISQADVVIITLGYTESWYDTEAKMYVNRSPGAHLKTTRAAVSSGRYEFHNVTAPEAMEALTDTINIIRGQNPAAKIVVTTSPVPLHGTFTSNDIVMANQYSKSTLQSTSVFVASQFEFVDYFPSYEYVTMQPRDVAFVADGIHVQRSVVASIMAAFLDAYLAD